MNVLIFAFLVAAFSSAGVSADTIRGPASGHSSEPPTDPGRSNFQAVVSGRALSQKDIVFRTILSTEGKDLSWPSFPRTWHEQSVSDYMVSNTALGLTVNGVGANVAQEYKWTLKTALVVIAGNRAEEAQLDSHGVTMEPVSDGLELQVFRWDPVNHRTLPNVRKGYPMIAFCAFEASMNVATLAKGGLTFMGSGTSIERGRVHSINHTLFSRFFQVDGTMSPIEMLDHICAAQYRTQVQDYVQRDFAYTVTELDAYSRSTCAPDASRDSALGDANCMDWHSANFGYLVRQATIPRCLPSKEGTNKCQLVSREGSRCPMYWDRSSSSAMDLPAASVSARYPKATQSDYEYSCDASAGLTCAMVKQPWVAMNTPFWPGVARCVRK